MIKKAGLLVLVCLVLVLLSPTPVLASDGPSVVKSSAEVVFPSAINFSLSATGDVNITDIRLYYRVDRMSFAAATSEVYVEFVPSIKVDAKWSWDMRKTGGLPPGTSLEYWWSVTDSRGGKAETRPVRVSFDDGRYAWRSLTRGQVTLYWYQGDDSFGGTLMTAAQQALSRLTGDSGAQLEKPMRIYIYANSRDLQGSMIFPQEWTGGVTFSEYGVIAIGIAPGQLDWGIRTVTHEFSHLIVHQLTFNPYNDLPTWLDEGLAMYNEGNLQPEFASLLQSAADRNTLISVQSLSSPFSALSGEALLAYAESYSIAQFLISTYGQPRMTDLLRTFKQGSGYDEALLKVYQFDMGGLNTRWHSYVSSAAPISRTESPSARSPWLVVSIAGLAAAVFLGLALLIWARARRSGH